MNALLVRRVVILSAIAMLAVIAAVAMLQAGFAVYGARGLAQEARALNADYATRLDQARTERAEFGRVGGFPLAAAGGADANALIETAVRSSAHAAGLLSLDVFQDEASLVVLRLQWRGDEAALRAFLGDIAGTLPGARITALTVRARAPYAAEMELHLVQPVAEEIAR